MGRSSDIDFLEEERKKIWQRVNSLEVRLDKAFEELNKNAYDYTDEAKQSSRKASEYRNRSETSKNTIAGYLEDALGRLDEIKEITKAAEILQNDTKNHALNAALNDSEIKKISDEISTRKDAIENQLQSIEAIFEDIDSLTEKVEKIGDTLTKSDETSTKIETLHGALLGRKKEIDQVYFQIFGYKAQQDGKETVVEGLKDKLTKSYNELSEGIKHSDEELSNLQKTAYDNYETFSKTNREDFETTITKWNEHYTELSKKIEALLPNALTAGLSSAYSEKKETEIVEYRNLNRTFMFAIGGLIFVSLIPFAVGTYSLVNGKPFDRVLLDMPRMVLSILPLYIPVLWVAYSSNRKMNLSKRLSEEYSHKEVLSKTFEGLSTQINSISDQKVSIDLRNKLLFNILEVSSENPGKLISDYNKSDHPLMDALDKSVKLAMAFDKLEKIPGFSSLAKRIDNKSKAILKDEAEKADKGIALLENDEGE